MRQFTLCICACAVAITTASVSAAVNVVLAADNASNYISSGWTNGSNQGFGFQPWVFGTSTGLTSGPNWQLGSSATNGPGDPNGDGDINTAGVAFGLSADSSTVDARRKFSNIMTPGMTFVIDMDNGTVAPFSTLHWAIGFWGPAYGNPENGYAQFAFLAGAGTANYFYFDGTGNGSVAHDTGIPVTSNGLHMEWTLTTPTTYHMEIQSLAGATLGSFDGLVDRPELQTNYFYLRKAGGALTPASIDYYNNISIVPEPAASSLLILVPTYLLRRRRFSSAVLAANRPIIC